MKAYAYLLVVLVLSTVANAGQTQQGQAAKNRAPSTSSKTTQGGQTTQGQAPKNGGLPGASSKAEGQGPGGGKGSSSINGTGMGTQH